MKLQYIIMLVLVGLVLVQGGIGYYQNKKADSERIGLYNQLAQIKEQQELADGVISKLAIQAGNIEALTKEAKDDIAKNGGTIRAQAQTMAEMKQTINSWFSSQPIDSSDTTYETLSDTIPIRAFDIAHENVYRIRGAFQIEDPYGVYLKDISARIPISFTLSENRNKTWTGYIESNLPGVSFEQTNISVNPYKPSWREQLGFFVGARGNFGWVMDKGKIWGAGALGGIEFQRAKLMLELNTNKQALVELEYTYPIFR